ncbi:MAG: ATP-binding cassette domain-containing protein [Phenylobacterium sp.]|nr:ATP-binding cassette domain-containing protein [Phenylobacterium sp.]
MIGAGDRLGVVAANGTGKSTLLRCIAGEFDATSGEITRARAVRVGHVPQDAPPHLMGVTLHDAVCEGLDEGEQWRADIVLESLAAPAELRDRRLDQLSGGWRRLALLARAWVGDPDVLLLDEPTNHLDLAKILQLEAWLNDLPRDVAVVVASHDRAFLDAVTHRTLFLRPERSQVFALPYSRARAALDEADEAEARRFDKDIRTAQQLRRQAAKLHNIGVNSGSDLLTTKTKQLKQRAEKLETAARPAHRERSAGAIRLDHRASQAKVLMSFDDAPVETPDGALLFKTGKLFILQGDRVVLLGANGAGKTRMMRLARAAIEGRSPTPLVKATPSLVLGYGDQGLADLDGDDTPLAAITRPFDVGDQRARALLAGAGIEILAQEKPIRQLSGGQRARVAMLVLRLIRPTFYLLDEPTNHLDIEGQEALEAELLNDDATALIVSHDRSFVRAVGERFWVIERRRLVEADDPEAFFAAQAEASPPP